MQTYLSSASKYDLYILLGCSPQTPSSNIKLCGKHILKKLHPDKSKSDLSTDLFTIISFAYKILCDPLTKKIYDAYKHKGLKVYFEDVITPETEVTSPVQRKAVLDKLAFIMKNLYKYEHENLIDDDQNVEIALDAQQYLKEIETSESIGKTATNIFNLNSVRLTSITNNTTTENKIYPSTSLISNLSATFKQNKLTLKTIPNYCLAFTPFFGFINKQTFKMNTDKNKLSARSTFITADGDNSYKFTAEPYYSFKGKKAKLKLGLSGNFPIGDVKGYINLPSASFYGNVSTGSTISARYNLTFSTKNFRLMEVKLVQKGKKMHNFVYF